MIIVNILSQSLINQGNILTNRFESFRSLVCIFWSQSLINQGNILTKPNSDMIEYILNKVAIPYKSGKYSNFRKRRRKTAGVLRVAIPYKSGKYSNKN